GNRRFIHPEVKRMTLQLANNPGMTRRKIRLLTGISERAQRRWKGIYDRTGDVIGRPLIAGRPRLLDAIDALFLEGCIERRPDIYVSELRKALLESRHVDASEPTIVRTLARR
ncbi:hypothetical protein B0H21DRAFT_676921, partial [Amylocystis lapponica]